MDDVENAKRIERAALETAGDLSEQELRSRNIRDKYCELADRIESQDNRDDNEVEELFANVLDELELALRIAYLAVHNTPENHPNRALHLHKLGIKLYELFLRSKSLSDLGKLYVLDKLLLMLRLKMVQIDLSIWPAWELDYLHDIAGQNQTSTLRDPCALHKLSLMLQVSIIHVEPCICRISGLALMPCF